MSAAPLTPEVCTGPGCGDPAPYVVHDRYVCVRHILWAAQQSGLTAPDVGYAPGWYPVQSDEPPVHQ